MCYCCCCYNDLSIMCGLILSKNKAHKIIIIIDIEKYNRNFCLLILRENLLKAISHTNLWFLMSLTTNKTIKTKTLLSNYIKFRCYFKLSFKLLAHTRRGGRFGNGEVKVYLKGTKACINCIINGRGRQSLIDFKPPLPKQRFFIWFVFEVT